MPKNKYMDLDLVDLTSELKNIETDILNGKMPLDDPDKIADIVEAGSYALLEVSASIRKMKPRIAIEEE